MNDKERKKTAILIVDIYNTCVRSSSGNLTREQVIKKIMHLLKEAEKEE